MINGGLTAHLMSSCFGFGWFVLLGVISHGTTNRYS